MLNHDEDGQPTSPLICRGIRGATTARANSAEAILSAASELLQAIIDANDIHQQDVASIIFTTTTDLNAAYPAQAVRQMGWTEVASLCAHEMDVPDGIPHCIRVLLHWNTRRRTDELIHIYLHGARRLRPDRSNRPSASESPRRGRRGDAHSAEAMGSEVTTAAEFASSDASP